MWRRDKYITYSLSLNNNFSWTFVFTICFILYLSAVSSISPSFYQLPILQLNSCTYLIFILKCSIYLFTIVCIHNRYQNTQVSLEFWELISGTPNIFLTNLNDQCLSKIIIFNGSQVIWYILISIYLYIMYIIIPIYYYIYLKIY